MIRAALAKSDITAWKPGLLMLGWAHPDNRIESVGDAIEARVLAVDDGELTLVYACAEVCFITQALREAVWNRIQARGLAVTEAGFCLTATHNHSGPSGISHSLLYNMTGLGLCQPVLDAVAEGITDAVEHALQAMEPAVLSWNVGTVDNEIAWNRCVASFNRNLDRPCIEPGQSAEATDHRMTLLRVHREDGTPLGAVSWFGLHGTTVHSDNTALRYDHKGAASRFWEANAPSEEFVAIFAQGVTGDVTPNSVWDEQRSRKVGDVDDLSLRDRIGRIQAEVAMQLWGGAGTTIRGPLQAQLGFVAMEDRPVSPAYAQGFTDARTTEAIAGLGLGIGTDEGPGPYHHAPVITSLIPRLLRTFRDKIQPYRASTSRSLPKAPMIQVGRGVRGRLMGVLPVRALTPFGWLDPTIAFSIRAINNGLGEAPWVPTVLPLQVLYFGPLAIAALPNEPTTTAGARMEDALMSHGFKGHVVINGYANAYSSYCVTPEEYDEQTYEGAMTLFGRWTLAAWCTELAALAKAQSEGTAYTTGVRSMPLPEAGVRAQDWAGGQHSGVGILSNRPAVTQQRSQ